MGRTDELRQLCGGSVGEAFGPEAGAAGASWGEAATTLASAASEAAMREEVTDDMSAACGAGDEVACDSLSREEERSLPGSRSSTRRPGEPRLRRRRRSPQRRHARETAGAGNTRSKCMRVLKRFPLVYCAISRGRKGNVAVNHLFMFEHVYIAI